MCCSDNVIRAKYYNARNLHVFDKRSLRLRHLGLHCLPVILLRVSSLKWVKCRVAAVKCLPVLYHWKFFICIFHGIIEPILVSGNIEFRLRQATSRAMILHKSSAGCYRPVRVGNGPITARYRFIKNASWEWW